MVSRSTERRRKLGLTQVSFDFNPALWPEIMAATGARTKTEAVDRALRAFVEGRRMVEAGEIRRATLATALTIPMNEHRDEPEVS